LHIAQTDCVAEDTVLIGLVCAPNSLLTGKFAGIFIDSWHFGVFGPEKISLVQRLAGISLESKQGIFFRAAGK
jgi:hypothetical protein